MNIDNIPAHSQGRDCHACGVVAFGVSVKTNGNFTAETKNWQPVTITKDMLDAVDGKGLVIPVPATAEQGFMILKSKGK